MKRNWLATGFMGIVAAIVYFAAMANYAYPGESAHLQALWRGLDTVTTPPYPLMAVFAKVLGAGNLLAPVCGVLAVALVCLLVSTFVRWRMTSGESTSSPGTISTVAGVAAALVFLLTPGVMGAATHLEPRLFDFTWALLALALTLPYAHAPRSVAWIFPILMAVMFGFGFCDSALFVALLPGALGALAAVQVDRGRKPYGALTLFVACFLGGVVLAIGLFGLELATLLKGIADELRGYVAPSGWLFVAVFATLPLVTVLFSSRKAYSEKPGFVQWIFHVTMTLAVILAVATPLAPSAQLETYGILPVATCAFAAAVAGHLVSYWWMNRKSKVGLVAGGILAFVLTVTCLWNLFGFERDKGAFADKIAARLLHELGDRSWLVSDGTLDDHLLLAAAKADRELNLIQLARDLDTAYLERFGKLVREKNIGGSKNAELALSLSLGVLPFVQDWFASDPSVAEEVAVYGAPDLWYSANIRPVPELLFFGADPKRTPDWSCWPELASVLEAPKGWGSYRMHEIKNPVDRMRLSIRRHLGLVANNRGVYLQDDRRDDDAFAMYELVLQDIDRDNICALFNELEMMNAKYAKAVNKKNELDRRIKQIVEDKDRRYVTWRLSSYYGYIRNPDMFIRQGFAWARSGRPGDALSQIKRAIEFVPSEKRQILLNMMASLYANENDGKKSRQLYESVLAKDADDHDALLGLMRLELMNGDSKKALGYLEKAAKVSKDPTRAKVEYAMVLMMKGDARTARDLLKAAADANPKNLQAWSLLAAVTMQLCDATKDVQKVKVLEKELANSILPAMERQADSPYDYYVQTTKAFLLMRQGEEKRREARDAFAAAVRARPDVQATQDLVLGLDISLNDQVQAEAHAREVLRRNRSAPLANYVMGSLALGKGEYVEAEAFLRKAVAGAKPNVLALNDLAEVLRRNGKYAEAEQFARQAVRLQPSLYVAWETLGSILIAANGNLDEAEAAIQKACALSKAKNGREEDVRMLVSLARIQLIRKDMTHARLSIRKVQARVSELSEFEKKEFEELVKGAR